MKKNKIKTFIKLLLVILAAFLLKVEVNSLFFGKTINSFFPCAQEVENSFPCYGNWDLGIMIIGCLFAVLVLLSSIIDLVKNKK